MSPWMDVLDHVERSLRQSLDQTAEVPAAPPREERGTCAALERFDARVRRWQASLDEARRHAAGADDAVAVEYAALQACRERLGNAVEALRHWAEPRA